MLLQTEVTSQIFILRDLLICLVHYASKGHSELQIACVLGEVHPLKGQKCNREVIQLCEIILKTTIIQLVSFGH